MLRVRRKRICWYAPVIAADTLPKGMGGRGQSGLPPIVRTVGRDQFRWCWFSWGGGEMGSRLNILTFERRDSTGAMARALRTDTL